MSGVKVGYTKKDKMWKLNDSILEDGDVKRAIEEIFNHIPNLKMEYRERWYDEFIGEITKFLKESSLKKSNAKKNRIKNLLDEILELRNSEDECEMLEFHLAPE